MSLVELLNQVDSEQEEMTKQAAEEDAAGRIMARGFMDELTKLAQFGPGTAPKVEKKPVPVKLETPTPTPSPGALKLKGRKPTVPPKVG